jgi:hypothetical protein
MTKIEALYTLDELPLPPPGKGLSKKVGAVKGGMILGIIFNFEG